MLGNDITALSKLSTLLMVGLYNIIYSDLTIKVLMRCVYIKYTSKPHQTVARVA